ncbi:MAG: hypothetical protein O7D29_08715, partial [Gemmatimonadetes bacterium]|nr:hypothetical protein [Gemmatimonadota bacterium]
MQIPQTIRDSFDSFLGGITDALPNIFWALVILLGGWIVAKIAKATVSRGLKLVRFPVFAEKAGIDGFLEKGGATRSATDLLALLVYWLV